MPAPTITAAPPPPLRSQNPATFNTLAENFVDWMAGAPDEFNALAAYLDGLTGGGGPITGGAWTMATSRLLGRVSASTGAIEELTVAQVLTLLGLANVAKALPLTFNFTSAGDAYFYADEAMTLTQQATTGAGSISYAKGTTAAPDTFTSTTSPISLQAGAWLKVSATDAVAVHLKRTA